MAKSPTRHLSRDNYFLYTKGSTDFNKATVRHIKVDKSVKTLDYQVFADCPKLSRVDLCDGLEKIKKEAFSKCIALKKIAIPKTVKSIESHAFFQCESLVHIDLGGGEGEGEGGGCTDDEDSNNNNNNTHDHGHHAPSASKRNKVPALDRVGFLAFCKCKKLRSIHIPDKVTKIERSTFMGCKQLKHVSLPKRLVSIGNSAFSSCSALQTIELPATVKSIEAKAFYYCGNLTSFTFQQMTSASANSTTKGGGNIGLEKLGEESFGYCESLQRFEIPPTVRVIEKRAFFNCTSLKAIIFHDRSLRSLSLTSVSGSSSSLISSSVTVGSGSSVVEGGSLRSRSLFPSSPSPAVPSPPPKPSPMSTQKSSLKIIGEESFAFCTTIKTVDIPSSVRTIDTSAFANCHSLTTVNLNDGIEKIGYQAFYKCHSLQNIRLPDSIRTIDKLTFSGCTALVMIELPKHLEYLGDSALERCTALKSVGLPSNLQTIGRSAFTDCHALSVVTIPSSVKQIGADAFSGCSQLIRAELPSGLQDIGTAAFRGCFHLKKPVLPATLQRKGSDIFPDSTVAWPDAGCLYKIGIVNQETNTVKRSLGAKKSTTSDKALHDTDAFLVERLDDVGRGDDNIDEEEAVVSTDEGDDERPAETRTTGEDSGDGLQRSEPPPLPPRHQRFYKISSFSAQEEAEANKMKDAGDEVDRCYCKWFFQEIEDGNVYTIQLITDDGRHRATDSTDDGDDLFLCVRTPPESSKRNDDEDGEDKEEPHEDVACLAPMILEGERHEQDQTDDGDVTVQDMSFPSLACSSPSDIPSRYKWRLVPIIGGPGAGPGEGGGSGHIWLQNLGATSNCKFLCGLDNDSEEENYEMMPATMTPTTPTFAGSNAFPKVPKRSSFVTYHGVPLKLEPVENTVHFYLESEHHTPSDLLANMTGSSLATPQLFRLPNTDHELPLHVSIRKNYPTDVIAAIVEKWPDAARVPNKDGDLPFHILLKQDYNKQDGSSPFSCTLTPHKLVPVLYSAFPNALCYRNMEGETPLQAGIMRNDVIETATVRAVLNLCPDSVKLRTEDKGDTLLHYYMKEKKRRDVLQTLLQAWPEAVSEQNYDGKTPIHICMERTQIPLGIIETLLQEQPDAAMVKDTEGYTALHFGIEHSLTNLNVLTKFLEVLDGDVAREKNIEGSTPLHTLVHNKSSLHFINALLKACPDAVKAKDALGQTPLHCCIRYKAEMEVIQAIYKAWPGGVAARNEENKTPVDYVKTFGAHPSVSNMFASTGYGGLGTSDGDSSKKFSAFHSAHTTMVLKKPAEQVAVRRGRFLLLDISPEEKSAGFTAGYRRQGEGHSQRFGAVFSEELQARNFLFDTLLAEFAKLINVTDKEVIKRAAALQAICSDYLSKKDDTVLDLPSFTSSAYWFSQEILKIVLRVYNEDQGAYQLDFSPPTLSDAEKCRRDLAHASSNCLQPHKHRSDSFHVLVDWLTGGLTKGKEYSTSEPALKPLQSLFNKIYIRRGQTQVNIIGDQTRMTLYVKRMDDLKKIVSRIERTFPHIRTGKCQFPNDIGVKGFLNQVHDMKRIPGTDLIPYRFKPNSSQKGSEATLLYNLNFFDEVPEYHRVGCTEIFVAFELQIGLEVEIVKLRSRHVAYERDRILDSQPLLKNFEARMKDTNDDEVTTTTTPKDDETKDRTTTISRSSDSSNNHTNILGGFLLDHTDDDLKIVDSVLEGNVSFETLVKLKDVTFEDHRRKSWNRHAQVPNRLCLNNKRVNAFAKMGRGGGGGTMTTTMISETSPKAQVLASFTLDPTKRYFVESLHVDVKDRMVGEGTFSVGLYAYFGGYYMVEISARFFGPKERESYKKSKGLMHLIKPGLNYSTFESVSPIPEGSSAVALIAWGRLDSGEMEYKKMHLVLNQCRVV